MAKVTYEREAVEQLAELPNVVLARMENIVRRLQDWPAVSGAKPLRGDLAGHYRIRTGDYRIQFRIAGDEEVDALQSLQVLQVVVVSGKIDVRSALLQAREKLFLKLLLAAVVARRSDWMVPVDHLPGRRTLR